MGPEWIVVLVAGGSVVSLVAFAVTRATLEHSREKKRSWDAFAAGLGLKDASAWFRTRLQGWIDGFVNRVERYEGKGALTRFRLEGIPRAVGFRSEGLGALL